MGIVTTELNEWWVAHQDYQESNTAKAKFQDIMNTIDQMLDELKTMNDNSDFNQLPASWKAKALWAWQQLDAARNTVKADAEFMEGINWRKP